MNELVFEPNPLLIALLNRPNIPNMDPPVITKSGPSGAGKSTLVNALVNTYPKYFGRVITFTTRDPRKGEKDGVDYFYKSKEEFRLLGSRGYFLESEDFLGMGNYYGTPRDQVVDFLTRGMSPIINLDINGAKALRACELFARRDMIQVFICPPTVSDLSRRLEKRGTDGPETVKKRLEGARGEYCNGHANLPLYIPSGKIKHDLQYMESILINYFLNFKHAPARLPD